MFAGEASGGAGLKTVSGTTNFVDFCGGGGGGAPKVTGDGWESSGSGGDRRGGKDRGSNGRGVSVGRKGGG